MLGVSPYEIDIYFTLLTEKYKEKIKYFIISKDE
jgi:hypothetical protein